MKATLTLNNPIKINGELVKELDYDPQKITGLQFCEACRRSAAMRKDGSMTVSFRENDYSLHFYLGIMAVIALNPQVDVTDLERVEGFDALTLTDIGLLFTLRKQAAPSEQSSSAEPSDNTAPDSTPA